MFFNNKILLPKKIIQTKFIQKIKIIKLNPLKINIYKKVPLMINCKLFQSHLYLLI